MPFVQWPTALPTRHIVGSWSREPDRAAEFTQFEDGPDLGRSMSQVSAYAEPVTIPMTAAEAELFWAFWEVTLDRGALIFEAPVYAPGAAGVPVRRVQIVGKPRQTEVGLDRYLITLMRKVYG